MYLYHSYRVNWVYCISIRNTKHWVQLLAGSTLKVEDVNQQLCIEHLTGTILPQQSMLINLQFFFYFITTEDGKYTVLTRSVYRNREVHLTDLRKQRIWALYAYVQLISLDFRHFRQPKLSLGWSKLHQIKNSSFPSPDLIRHVTTLLCNLDFTNQFLRQILDHTTIGYN